MIPGSAPFNREHLKRAVLDEEKSHPHQEGTSQWSRTASGGNSEQKLPE
jgi:hypothetical protein